MEFVRIGGVPEHFNYPWRIAIRDGHFFNLNLDVQWMDYPSGTGALMQDLDQGKLDMAIVLTEGAINAISKGAKAQIVGKYVVSPLIWGIYTGHKRTSESLLQKQNPIFAISRIGSGSHLMAYLLAERQGWNKEAIQFKIVNTIEGANEALNNGEADLFLWEVAMTEPWVKAEKFDFLGTIPTPWPSFVCVVSTDWMQRKLLITNPKEMLQVALSTCKTLKEREDSAHEISNFFNLNPELIQEWLGHVQWPADVKNDADILRQVWQKLADFQIIQESHFDSNKYIISE